MTIWKRKPAAYDDDKTLQQNRDRDRGAVKCPTCGATHDLEMGDSECSCGQEFNGNGQALVPRSQWEEDYDY